MTETDGEEDHRRRRSPSLDGVTSQSVSPFFGRFDIRRCGRFPTLSLQIGEAPLQQYGRQLTWAHVSTQAGEPVGVGLQFPPHLSSNNAMTPKGPSGLDTIEKLREAPSASRCRAEA